MVEQALDALGRKIDAGESLETDIHQGALDDMLRSLGLIQSLSGRRNLPAGKENANET